MFPIFLKGITSAVGVTIMLSLAPWTAAKAQPGLSPQTLKELAQARRATARYHNILNAISDGYINGNYVVEGVGCHMVNLNYLFDFGDPAPNINLEKPELLVYADCSGTAGGRSELRAVEYSLPCPEDCSQTPAPTGFTGDHDAWHVFPGDASLGIPPQWTLHAWTWRHNPDGLFVTLNPVID